VPEEGCIDFSSMCVCVCVCVCTLKFNHSLPCVRARTHCAISAVSNSPAHPSTPPSPPNYTHTQVESMCNLGSLLLSHVSSSSYDTYPPPHTQVESMCNLGSLLLSGAPDLDKVQILKNQILKNASSIESTCQVTRWIESLLQFFFLDFFSFLSFQGLRWSESLSVECSTVL
jgi:hypothetical protein